MTSTWQEELPWNEHPVQVGSDGTLRLVLGGVPVLDARVLLPGWSASPPLVEADTVAQRFTRNAATVLVRHTLGAVWHLSVDLDMPTGATDLHALGMPELHLDAVRDESGHVDAPVPAVWLLGGGALGHAVCQLPDGTHLHWRQLSGDCEVVLPGDADPGHGNPERRVLRLLQAATTGTHRLRWRAEQLDVGHHPGRQLPPWLPARTVLDAGEELTFDLPDAAISSDRAECGVLDERTIVPVPSGRQTLTVAQAGGATRLVVTGVPGAADDLAARARRIVADADPRSMGGVQLWLVLHARDAVAADDLLAEAAEEVAAATSRLRVPNPFAVAALAVLSGTEPAGADLAGVAADAVRRWHDILDRPDREEPDLKHSDREQDGEQFDGASPRDPGTHDPLPAGACLATAWVRMACRQLGVPAPDMLPASVDAGPAALEQAIASGDSTRGPALVRRWRPVLGPAIPGGPARPDEALLVAGLLRLAPPAWWQDASPAPKPDGTGLTSHDISSWERRLRADPGASGDRWAAWLLW